MTFAMPRAMELSWTFCDVVGKNRLTGVAAIVNAAKLSHSLRVNVTTIP
jgi:hypothetical protein